MASRSCWCVFMQKHRALASPLLGNHKNKLYSRCTAIVRCELRVWCSAHTISYGECFFLAWITRPESCVINHFIFFAPQASHHPALITHTRTSTSFRSMKLHFNARCWIRFNVSSSATFTLKRIHITPIFFALPFLLFNCGFFSMPTQN